MDGIHFSVSAMAADDDQYSLRTCQSKFPNIKIRAASRAVNSYMGFKSPGGVIVLSWWFVNLVIYNFVMTGLKRYFSLGQLSAYIAFMIIPISGWVADSCVGRYNFIKNCYRIMWFISLLLTATHLATYLPIKGDEFTIHCIKIILHLLLLICMGCSTVNMIQFGIDQFQDASSSEIILYIKWYSWTYFASLCTTTIIQMCTCKQYQAVVSLLPFTLLSWVLCSDFLFNKALAKEPVMKNAFRQIFGVLKYSIANKFPQTPSSSADWNHKGIWSRIDLAKVVFGGPYSNGDVEDVKTFFRICVIFLLAAIMLTAVLTTETMIPGFDYHIPNCSDYATCLWNQLSVKSGYFFISLCVPIYLKLQFVRKHLPYLKILTRLTIGGLCCMLALFIILSIFSSHQQPSSKNCSTNHTLYIPTEYAPYWFILPSLLNCFGMYLGMVSGIEFICAQCPYTMKGLIYGLLYFCLGCGFTMFAIIDSDRVIGFIPNHYCILLNRISFKIIINISIALLFGIVGTGGVCCYKVRSREDSG